MTTETRHYDVVHDERVQGGEPVIRGTRTPVRSTVQMWRMGALSEEIPSHLPHLMLAQVFDALSYFADSSAEITQHIERHRVLDEELTPLDGGT